MVTRGYAVSDKGDWYVAKKWGTSSGGRAEVASSTYVKRWARVEIDAAQWEAICTSLCEAGKDWLTSA